MSSVSKVYRTRDGREFEDYFPAEEHALMLEKQTTEHAILTVIFEGMKNSGIDILSGDERNSIFAKALKASLLEYFHIAARTGKP